MRLKKIIAVLVLTLIGFGGPALGAKEEGERFKMSKAKDGFVRLDTQTGAMSLCTRSGEGWSCLPMTEDQRSISDEIARLHKENDELKDEIRRMEETFGLEAHGSQGGKDDKDGKDGKESQPGDQADARPEIRLPDEEQVDQAIDYLERMIRKFRERFEKFGDRTKPRFKPHGSEDDRSGDGTPL